MLMPRRISMLVAAGMPLVMTPLLLAQEHGGETQELDRAKREINVAKDTALKELYERSADLAIAMAGNVLRRELTPRDQEQLVQEALTQLSGSAANRG